MATDLTEEEAAQIDEYYSYFQTVKKDIVKPERVVDHQSRINLTNLDIFHPEMRGYVPILFAYRLSDTSDTFYDQFVLGLKQSLAKVLVSFYPAAGGLVKTGDVHHTSDTLYHFVHGLKQSLAKVLVSIYPAARGLVKTDDVPHPLVIVCDDRGVPFIEAYKDEPMDDIVKNQEPVTPLSGLEAVRLFSNRKSQEITESGVPCIVIQITRFKCGGVCIAFNWDHGVADMSSAMVLVKAWADIASKGETTVIPQTDRAFLNVIHANETERAASQTVSSPEDDVAKVEIVPTPDISMKVLHIRKDKIAMVKQAALDDGYVVSTLDCISAHLWRFVAKHRATSTGTDISSFGTIVEGRQRMSASGTLLSNYFGNVLVPAFLWNKPTTELVSQPLAYTASLIRKAIQEINSESYWDLNNKLEEVTSGWSVDENLLIIHSWIRFGIYDLDFGCGTPLRFQRNILPKLGMHGQCFVLPGNPSEGGFDVLMYLHSGSGLFERLWADPEFTSLS
ncbi:hypothetical protein R1sor_016615 [Riccia sorocarpa]|uniref:Uncharacterized protein n=1 Tax=Riccia sorocarpa TaxID=122646 RepID=A0ABD3HHH9_9MARC